MRIQQINNKDINHSTNFKSLNKITKYGIESLIAASSLFMFSNAIDSFESSVPTKEKQSLVFMNSVASVLAIAGTVFGIAGMKKDEEDKR